MRSAPSHWVDYFSTFRFLLGHTEPMIERDIAIDIAIDFGLDANRGVYRVERVEDLEFELVAEFGAVQFSQRFE